MSASAQLYSLNGRVTTFKKSAIWYSRANSFATDPEKVSPPIHFDDSEDNVACFLCNKNLDGWEEGDEAWEEHQKHSPNCPLVRLDHESNRLLTFHSDLWPHFTSRSPLLSPQSVSPPQTQPH